MTKAEAYRPGHRGVIFWSAAFLVIIYGNSLAGQFVFDDWSMIVARPELRPPRPSCTWLKIITWPETRPRATPG
ncbi:MAG: hypothetical protein ACLFPD_11480 [Desulfosudaceae bacterium]